MAALARSLGAEPLVEPANRGHTAAVAFAQAEAVRQGAARFLTIPGDVPCVTRRRRSRALLRRAAGAAGVVLRAVACPASGTNGALLVDRRTRCRSSSASPPSTITWSPRAQRGLTPVICELPGLGLDIDTPEDLRLLLARGAHTRSAALVSSGTSRSGPQPRTRPDATALRGDRRRGHRPRSARRRPRRAHRRGGRRQGTPLAARDMLVVSQKIVSKAEGRLVRLSEVTPSAERAGARRRARARSAAGRGDPEREPSRRAQGQGRADRRDAPRLGLRQRGRGSVQRRRRHRVPPAGGLRPLGARAARPAAALTGHELAMIIADTFGRPWREGLVNVAVGVAGLRAAHELSRRAGSRGPRAAGHDPGARRRAGRRGRAGDGQARPHSGRDRPRAAPRPSEEGSNRALLRDPARDLSDKPEHRRPWRRMRDRHRGRNRQGRRRARRCAGRRPATRSSSARATPSGRAAKAAELAAQHAGAGQRRVQPRGRAPPPRSSC